MIYTQFENAGKYTMMVDFLDLWFSYTLAEKEEHFMFDFSLDFDVRRYQ